MPNPVKIMPLNEHGRDFIVGDIHGAYDLLDEGLRQVDFDEARDRLFSVGDLIDRGTRSSDCIQYLEKPWFHATQGNHEDLFLGIFTEAGEMDYEELMEQFRNGMDWVMGIPRDRVDAIRRAFLELPIAIEIPTKRGTVGIVHAEIPSEMNWSTFKHALETGNKQVIHTALWGRNRINYRDINGVQGVDRVFHGHTPQYRGTLRLGNCYYIDTGAVFREIKANEDMGLTFANMNVGTDRLTEGSAQDLRQPVRTLPEAVERPFGHYAPGI